MIMVFQTRDHDAEDLMAILLQWPRTVYHCAGIDGVSHDEILRPRPPLVSAPFHPLFRSYTIFVYGSHGRPLPCLQTSQRRTYSHDNTAPPAPVCSMSAASTFSILAHLKNTTHTYSLSNGRPSPCTFSIGFRPFFIHHLPIFIHDSHNYPISSRTTQTQHTHTSCCT